MAAGGVNPSVSHFLKPLQHCRAQQTVCPKHRAATSCCQAGRQAASLQHQCLASSKHTELSTLLCSHTKGTQMKHIQANSRSSSCSPDPLAPGFASALPLLPGLTCLTCKAAICLCAFRHKSFLMKYCAAFSLTGGSALVHTFHINPCISQACSFIVTARMHDHTHRQQTEHQFQLYKISKMPFFLFRAVQITKELSHLLFLETSTARISSKNLICTQCVQTSHLLPHELSYQHF